MRGRFVIAVIGCVVLSTPAAAGAAGWTIAPAPSPNVSVPLTATLSAVSCASPSMCVAVGSYIDSNGNPAGTLAELWNGSSWSLLTTPKLPAATLDGVSCPTVSARSLTSTRPESHAGSRLGPSRREGGSTPSDGGDHDDMHGQ